MVHTHHCIVCGHAKKTAYSTGCGRCWCICDRLNLLGVRDNSLTREHESKKSQRGFVKLTFPLIRITRRQIRKKQAKEIFISKNYDSYSYIKGMPFTEMTQGSTKKKILLAYTHQNNAMTIVHAIYFSI